MHSVAGRVDGPVDDVEDEEDGGKHPPRDPVDVLRRVVPFAQAQSVAQRHHKRFRFRRHALVRVQHLHLLDDGAMTNKEHVGLRNCPHRCVR